MLWELVGMQNISGCPIGWVSRCPSQGGFNHAEFVGSDFYCQSGMGGGCRFAAGGMTANERYQLDDVYYVNELFRDFAPFAVEVPSTSAALEVRTCASGLNHPNRSNIFFHKLSLAVF